MDETTGNKERQDEQRFLPHKVWYPMLLRRLDALMQSDPERFDVWRIRKENPPLFQEIKAKSDAVRSLRYPTEAEVMTYAAEFASLFPEITDVGVLRS